MGVAGLADRLADRLVAGVRDRMRRVRFATTVAVSSVVCETLADELPVDDISTPSVCFEWLVLEAFTRRVKPADLPDGLPGSQKARAVVGRQERLSAETYLKGPRVFGFHGVYKPFALDAGLVGDDLDPGPRALDLVRAWEAENELEGFADDLHGSEGATFRRNLIEQTRNALLAGRCTTKPNSGVFGRLAGSLNPDEPGLGERARLRALVVGGEHELRTELTTLLPIGRVEAKDHELLAAVHPSASSELRGVIDAVLSYERLAVMIDAAFSTLCVVSHSMGAQPLTPDVVRANEVIEIASRTLPEAYREALDRMAAVGADNGVEERLGEFAIERPAAELVEVLLDHHERIQSAKPPSGKRPWFEPLRSGWVVRPPYGSAQVAPMDGTFLHPMRVVALSRFLRESAP